QRGPSPNYRERKYPGKISAVVVHATASTTAEPAISWMLSPSSGVSSHYVIDLDGKIYQLVREDSCAYHAGFSMLHGTAAVNEFSVGIEIVGMEAPFKDEQMKSAELLTADICYRNAVPLNRVVGHCHVATPYGRKIDPGSKFPWEEFLLGVSRT